MISRMFGRRIGLSQAAGLPLVALVAIDVADAQPTATWAGGAGSWFQASRWTEGVVPPAGAIVYIDGGNPMTSVVTGASSHIYGGLVLTEGDRWGNGTLRLTGEAIVDGTVSGTLLVHEALTMRGSGLFSGSIFANTSLPPGMSTRLTLDGITLGAVSIGSQGSSPALLVDVFSPTSFGIPGPSPAWLYKDLQNHSILTAVNLRVGFNTIHNEGALIDVSSGGTLVLSGTTIAGGELRTSGSVTCDNAKLDGRTAPVTITGEIQNNLSRPMRDLVLSGGVLELVGNGSGVLRDGVMEFSGGGEFNLEGAITVRPESNPIINRDCLFRGDGSFVAASFPPILVFQNYGRFEPDGHVSLPRIDNDGDVRVRPGTSLSTIMVQRNQFTVEAGGAFSGTVWNEAPLSVIEGNLTSAYVRVLEGEVRITNSGFGPAQVLVTGGRLDLTGAPRKILLSQTLRLDAGSVMSIDFCGNDPENDTDLFEFPLWQTSSAALDGTLELVCAPGCVPTSGARFRLIGPIFGGSHPRPRDLRLVGFPNGLGVSFHFGDVYPGATALWIIVTHPGDLNCDGVVDLGDIAPFVLRLTNLDAYRVLYPGCNGFNADINRNGAVSVGDIAGMVDLLIAN